MVGAAYADYGIVLSNTCLTMLKNNISTNCPGYDEIMALFPDTSNQKVSGGFIYKDGILQREEPQYEHHYNNYIYESKDKMWIDPPGDVLDRIHLITITSRDFIYPIKDQKITDSSIKIGQGRYIAPNCRSAIITAENWPYLLGDTMVLLLHNCDRTFTNFDEIKIQTWERTKHDITTSYKWKLDQWVKESKEKCSIQKCFYIINQTKPPGRN